MVAGGEVMLTQSLLRFSIQPGEKKKVDCIHRNHFGILLS